MNFQSLSALLILYTLYCFRFFLLIHEYTPSKNAMLRYAEIKCRIAHDVKVQSTPEIRQPDWEYLIYLYRVPLMLSFIYTPKSSLSNFIRTDHDGTSWCYFQRSRYPSFEQSRCPFRLEDMP